MPLSPQTVAAVTQALAEASVTAEAQSLSRGTTLLRMGVPLSADAETVWAHLTEPEALARWSPVAPAQPLAQAGSIVAVQAEAEGKRQAEGETPADIETPAEGETSAGGAAHGDDGDPGTLRVIEAEAPVVLRHTWGDGEVLWEITQVPLDEEATAEIGAATVLTVTQTFSQDAQVPLNAAGWHVCLAVLSLLMEGKAVERVVGEDAREVGWEPLHDAYARGFAEQA